MKLIPNSYQSGLFAEFLARWFLRLHGFRIVKSRYITGRYTGRAEIDIIARSGNLLLFCEVKNRPNAEKAFAAIGAAQAGRLRVAAETYLIRTNWTGDSRFDVLAVGGWKVKWFKNAV
jgi:putative endonuclease